MADDEEPKGYGVRGDLPLFRDCPWCQGELTMQLTYALEGDYSEPYVCHVCLRDPDGGRYKRMPSSIMDTMYYGD